MKNLVSAHTSRKLVGEKAEGAKQTGHLVIRSYIVIVCWLRSFARVSS